MKQTFSRWPGSAGNAGAAEVPLWMMTSGERRRGFVGSSAFAVALVVLCSVAWWWVGARFSILPLAAGVVLSATTAGLLLSQLRRVRESAERYEKVFDGAGAAMWLEDWSAAGEAVRGLRLAGVTDMERYFASRPDELRKLRSQVMIKDVNRFTVEDTGQASKESYIGSLDALLPDTDQTFVQWLVAFSRGDRFFRSEAHIATANGGFADSLFTARLPQTMNDFRNIVVISFDITSYKLAQERLLANDADFARKARITTVGALSASIAHEINSPLAALVANARAALRWLSQPEPRIEEATAAISELVGDATRARDVVARTRAFVSNAPSNFVAANLLAIVRDAVLLIDRDLRELGAVVHIDAEDDLPDVSVEVILVQQVFTNLLTNAAQAMETTEGPRDIRVTLCRHASAVEATIRDQGVGIPSDRLPFIFEPFHSTKPHGMGMGLAICRNVLDGHGGDIFAASSAESGTTFTLTLPLAEG